jgi:hypothetical protein
MYASSWWVRYRQSKDKRHLLRSRDLYREAFRLDPKDSYTGINAATKSLFLAANPTRRASDRHGTLGR